MIATEQKSRSEILELLQGASKIFLIGCGDCATVCQTGGAHEIAEMKAFLEEQGKQVVGSLIPDSGCQVLDLKRLLRSVKEAVAEADAFLVMSCGAGVQAATENLDKPVYPANNTLFLADTRRMGQLYEWCSSCGECVIGDYGGICPVTRCPKGQLNGPCGGTADGKCEVDPEQDCVWTLIYQRFDRVPGREKMERQIFAAKNNQVARHPRQRLFEPRRGK